MQSSHACPTQPSHSTYHLPFDVAISDYLCEDLVSVSHIAGAV